MTESFSQVLSTIEYFVTSNTPFGQSESRHPFLIKQIPGGTLLAVADGTGRGGDARVAARLAITTIDERPSDGIIGLMRACHERLKGTRGAMVTLVSINGIESTVSWLGVGSVEGMLLRFNSLGEASTEPITARAGVVGYRLPVLQATATPIGAGDVIILYTEGIRGDLVRQFSSEDQLGNIAEYIASNARTGSQEGLVLVARFLGASH